MNTFLATNRRRFAAAVVSAAVLGGSAAAVAATQNPGQAESQAVIKDAAAQIGVTPAKLTDALQQALIDRVNADVTAGTMTRTQADQAIAAIKSGQMPLVGGGRGGRGHDGMRGPMGIGGAAASFLGLTVQQIRTETDAGQTLAQVATAHGKTVADLKAAITTSVTKDLDAAVKAGQITATEKTHRLAGLSAHIDQELNETHTAGGDGSRGNDSRGDAPPTGGAVAPAPTS